LRAAGWLILIRLIVWIVPFRRVWRWFCPALPKSRSTGSVLSNCEYVANARWAVHAVGRRLPGATCLVRALTLKHLLGQHSIACELRIGVKRGIGEPFEAHAWVEVDGRPLTDGEDLTTFVVFPGLEAKLA